MSQSVSEADEEVLAAALSSQLDLRTLSEEAKVALYDSHRRAVRTCIEHADEVALLHNEILACDDVFEVCFRQSRSCRYLFHSCLSETGEAPPRLPVRSRLHRGRHEEAAGAVPCHQQRAGEQEEGSPRSCSDVQVRRELSQFVDDMTVPKDLRKVVCDVDAGDRLFLEQLHELQHKLQFVKSQEFKEARAVEDVVHDLDDLRIIVRPLPVPIVRPPERSESGSCIRSTSFASHSPTTKSHSTRFSSTGSPALRKEKRQVLLRISSGQ